MFVPSSSRVASSSGLPLSLTGATAATRYVGGTATVAPTTGTFAVGDFVIGQNGTLFVCTTAGSPGTWTQVGGSAGTTGSAALSGNNVSFANNATHDLTWNAQTGTLLDISTPTLPTFVAAGTYALTVNIVGTAFTAAGGYSALLQLSTGAIAACSSPGSTTGLPNPSVTMTVVTVATAGDNIELSCTSKDGSSTRNILLNSAICTRLA